MGSFQFGQDVEQVATTATAAGTTTLTNTSKQNQVFSGVLSQTIVLPDATTMSVGQSFMLVNQSSLSLTLNFNGGSAFTDASGTAYSTIFPHQALQIKLQTNAGGSPQPGTWIVATNNVAGVSLIQPTVQKFLSGSGTYTTPANVSYITVEMVGGGGGGGGGGGASAGSPGTAGNSTVFGTYTCSGGTGGPIDNGTPAAGGTLTIGSGATVIKNLPGGIGGGPSSASGGAFNGGGNGGSSGMGAAPGSGNPATTGNAAPTNSGSGGSGGGGSAVGTHDAGSGGGAGAYALLLINNPTSTYSYSVGGTAAGGIGSSGGTGGLGAAGQVIVTEYYNQTIASGVTVTASTAPTVQTFLSGSGTYNRPTGVQYIIVRIVGAGGGGGGTTGAGGTGGTTTFGTSLLSATGGAGGNPNNSGSSNSGGVGSGGAINTTGSSGAYGAYPISGAQGAGGLGGSSAFGGGGYGGSPTVGGLAGANGGGGGGAGSASASVGSGQGGGAGGYCEAVINNPSATYSYSVGAGGGGGSGTAGGAGGAGLIEVTEHYTVLATGGFTGGGANVPTVQKFLSGSGTYTTPANVLYIDVKMVGGGGGGGGSCTSAGNNGGTGGTGGTTTFGTSLLTAAGGLGGGGTSQASGGAGGAITVNSPAINASSFSGSQGDSTQESNVANVNLGGKMGGASPFSGGGPGGPSATAGRAPLTNSGSGGGGGGAPSTGIAGAGGGSGGYIEAIITSPLSTYAYGIGTAGTAGTAGTGGQVGGAGASGIIEVTEYYANGTVGTATSITGSVNSSQVLGTVAGGNAPTGFIGEFISANSAGVAVGSTGAFVTVTSISLTAGDWDVEGTASLVTGGTTAGTIISGGISLNPTSEDTQASGGVFDFFGTLVASSTYLSPTGKRRVNVSTTTTVYLVAAATYTVAGGATWGTNSFLGARRVR